MKLPDFGQNRHFAGLRKRMATSPWPKQAPRRSSKTDKKFLGAIVNGVKKIGERRRFIREANKTVAHWREELKKNERKAEQAQKAAENALLLDEEQNAKKHLRLKLTALEACERIEDDIRSIETLTAAMKMSNDEDMFEIERLKRQHEMWILKHEAAQTQNRRSGIAHEMDIKAEKKGLERELNKAPANEPDELVEQEMTRLRERLQPSGEDAV